MIWITLHGGLGLGREGDVIWVTWAFVVDPTHDNEACHEWGTQICEWATRHPCLWVGHPPSTTEVISDSFFATARSRIHPT